MALIADLKRKLFQRKLEKELATRRTKQVVRSLHPETAKHLAVLFLADNADDRKLVEKLKTERRKNGLQTRLLGYFSSPVNGNGSYNFPYFTVKDLNWYGVPQGKEVEIFLSDRSDLLYVLGSPGDQKMDYLARLKNTSLRVGPFTHEDDVDNPYNVRIINDGKQRGIKGQLNQIDRIFKIINVKKVAAV